MPKSKKKKTTKPAKRAPKKASGPTKLTPVLYVQHIEPCLDLWVTRLGFTKAVEMPEGDRLGFVILKKGAVEVMYQSMASVAKDVPAMATRAVGGTNLFVEVTDIDAVERAVQGLPVVVPRRKTRYGSTEVGVRDAGGNVVLFAQMG